MESDQTDRIERIEAFEDKAGVRLEALYAGLREGAGDQHVRLIVRGEAHATRNNSKIKNDIEIVLAAYDAQGRVIGKGDHFIGGDSFFSFEVFEIDLYDLPVPPERIRLYPKLS